ncbi:MAG TPA: polysaccharide deacetylase family protein [Flavitalea sp.]|nr:polysaccharide deacetylase family protein [Flavitalea sp.]
MGYYTIKTPWLLKKLYPGCVWAISTKEKIIYLTFDDGPHPVATPFVLDALSRYQAKATFFCIGKNVVQYPDIYRRIILGGHRVGNHTFNHLNGWKVTDKEYFGNISLASKHIDSKLFRPPYGKISAFQIRHLKADPLSYRIIMWDVLSGDFDLKLTPEACSFNVTRYSRNGSIVVFHDSEKAFPRLQVGLLDCLKFFSEKGFRFESIPGDSS